MLHRTGGVAGEPAPGRHAGHHAPRKVQVPVRLVDAFVFWR